MVMVEQNKVSSAAKILKINDSTAKMTIRAFKMLPPEEQQQILLNGAAKKTKKIKEPAPPNRPLGPPIDPLASEVCGAEREGRQESAPSLASQP
jgi:hypothetical protein